MPFFDYLISPTPESPIMKRVSRTPTEKIAEDIAAAVNNAKARNSTNGQNANSPTKTTTTNQRQTQKKSNFDDLFLEGFNSARDRDWRDEQQNRMQKFGIGMPYGSITQKKTPAPQLTSDKLTPEDEKAFLEGFNKYRDEDKAEQSNLQKARQAYVDMQNQTPKDTLRRIANGIGVQSPLVIKNDDLTPDDNKSGFVESIKHGAMDSIDAIKNLVSVFNSYKKDSGIINATSKTLDHYGVLDDVTNGFFKTYDFVQEHPGIISAVGSATLNPKALVPLKIVDSVVANKNYMDNQNVDLNKYEGGRYINDQNAKDSKMSELQYGLWDMYNNGCGLIATYNSLNTLNNHKDIRDIAREFEDDGKVLGGLLGTSPYAIGKYFKKQGYDVKTYEGDETIDNLEPPTADSYILSFWNNNRFSSAIHTVSISKQPDGTYKVYNSDGRNEDTVDSIEEYLFEERRFGRRVPLVLHCISKKGEGK